jgi:purine-cytosine permease-like protein
METLEPRRAAETDDYAVKPVPSDARLPVANILNVTLGIAGAMVFLQIGGQMALSYGSVNAILALVYATLATGLLGTAFARVAASTGLSSNLLARGSGYGYVGAVLGSLIYASSFIVLAAIEGSIMAHAIYSFLPIIPLPLVMVAIGLMIIPLNWYGMASLNRLQKYSLPFHFLLLVSAIVMALNRPAVSIGNWLTFLPAGQRVGGISLLTCIGILNGIVGVQSILTADFARFIKAGDKKRAAILVGFVPQIASFFVMGLAGIWLTLRFGEANPGVYMVMLMAGGGAAYTVLSQLRINLINIYSSSLSLASFFSQSLHFEPGRVFWVCLSAIAALAAMLLNVLDHIGPVLNFQGVCMFAWAASMLTDIWVVKRLLGMGPREIEHDHTKLRAWNPVGICALVSGSIAGTYCALIAPNPVMTAASSFIASGVAFVVHVSLAVMTRGRFHRLPIARQTSPAKSASS